MKNKICKINAAPCITLGALVFMSSFFMFDFYMCLSGFVANKFAEPLVMLPIVISFFIPVLAALLAVYHLFVGRLCKIGKIIASSVMAVLSLAAISLVMINIPLYVRNHALGAYSSTLGIFLFPYDTVIANLFVLFFSVLGIISGAKSSVLPTRVKNLTVSSLKFKLAIPEYIAYSVLAIVVFVFAGAGISGVGSIANALYDLRYLFLIVWVGLIPIVDLATLVAKPERFKMQKWCRTAILSSVLLFNLVVCALLFILELTKPGFIIQIGKPLFMIAFSVSLPIEMLILLGIMALTVILITAKLVIMHFIKKESAPCKKCEKCDKCASV